VLLIYQNEENRDREEDTIKLLWCFEIFCQLLNSFIFFFWSTWR